MPEVQAELERFGQYVGKMLLFLRFLRVVRVSTWAMGAMTPQQTLRVSSCAGTGIVLRQCAVCAVVPTCQLPTTLAVADTAFLYFRQTWLVTPVIHAAVQQCIQYSQQCSCGQAGFRGTASDVHAFACPQVTLTPQMHGARVPFEERDWRNLSLGQGFSQLVRGKTGQRKVLDFTLLQTDGAWITRLPGTCL